jgi:hypothetical protein
LWHDVRTGRQGNGRRSSRRLVRVGVAGGRALRIPRGRRVRANGFCRRGIHIDRGGIRGRWRTCSGSHVAPQDAGSRGRIRNGRVLWHDVRPGGQTDHWRSGRRCVGIGVTYSGALRVT